MLNEPETNNVLEVKIQPLDKSKIMVQIASEDRDAISNLIQDNYNHSISRLAEKVQMHGPNVYNAINGTKTVSLAVIDKIVSAIGYQADLGVGNTLLITPRKTEEAAPVQPKSMFGDLPEGIDLNTIKRTNWGSNIEDFEEL